MASLIDKLTNVLMPEEEEADEVKVKETRPAKKVKNASRYERSKRQERFADAEVSGERFAPEQIERPERPVLTVHTNKAPELKVVVYTPKSFDEANLIANALKNREAVVVNYEAVDGAEQRRLCDFINGVCYILDGGVQRISEQIVLYVPANVYISKDLPSYTIPSSYVSSAAGSGSLF